jgi:AcrR family transcriptional regulator
MVSNKSEDGVSKRGYTLRARARRQEDVHHRITLAAVHLHGTVGPARTTMSEIAKLAGVQRATVYNHFPTELDLIDACSSHWFAENPPPDPTSWTEISDPGRRAETALTAMYGYYDRGKPMLEKVLRDATLVAALGEILEQKWSPMMEGIVELLAQGWESREPELRACLRVALDFFTWRTLATSGLANDDAARLMATWIGSNRKPSP